MEEATTFREKILKEFSISKSWLVTNLVYVIFNKIDRCPIFIKSSVSPCRDTFWDARFEYGYKVANISFYYRDGRQYNLIDMRGFNEAIELSSDVNVLTKYVSEYVEKLSKICFEKLAISIVN